jgi:hypothetical protein
VKSENAKVQEGGGTRRKHGRGAGKRNEESRKNEGNEIKKGGK